MLRDSERQAARLAESRFGLNPAQVLRLLDEVSQARATGADIDLLTLLIERQLLTTTQAAEIAELLQREPMSFATPRPAAPGATDLGVARGEGDGDLSFTPLRLGNYRVLRKLGEGGMCPVFLAEEIDNHQKAAIKVLPPRLAHNRTMLDRFYREARSGALLDHPNIVRNLAAGQDQATQLHYLVMEYIDGASAQALLDHFGRLPVPEAVRIILDAGRGLEHAHSRNVIHRDIKPDNILLTRSGVVKLADLGLAKRVDEASHLTAARQGFGTPHYMPYEQAVNARNADGRSDIYALGATLYHLVTGEVPFRATSQVEVVEKKKEGIYPPPSQLNPDVPPVLEKILRKMLAPDPRARYQTVHELIADLEQTNLAAPALRSVERLLMAVNGQEEAESGVGDAQPTVPDLATAGAGRPGLAAVGDLPSGGSGVSALGQDVWYIRFRDSSGQLLKTRASTRQVKKRLAEGRLPADAEAARSLQSEFKPLFSYPELLPEGGRVRVQTEPVSPPPQGEKESGQVPPRLPASATPASDLEPSWRWFEPSGRPTWCFFLAAALVLAIIAILGIVLQILWGV